MFTITPVVFLGRTPTSPDDEVKVDVKRQQAEATLHVRDVYVGAKIGDEQGVGLREGEGGVLRGLQLEITRLCESDSILVKMEAIKNFDRILSATLHTGL
eukprot:492404-Amorphochlora_amoeboformis.AAC.2